MMKYRTLVELIRPLNGLMAGIGAFIGLLVGGWGIGFSPQPFMAVVVPFLISSGGMVLNDYFDKDIDKGRPIQRGEISPRGAVMLALFLYFLGLVLAFMISLEAGLIASIAALLLTFYDALLARKPFIGNLVVAANTGLTFPFGAAFAGVLFTPAISVLFLLAFFSTLARETYKGIQDMEKDKKTRKTLAIKVGPKAACLFAAIFNLLAVIVSPIPYVLGIFGLPYLAMIVLLDLGFLYTLASAFKSKDFYIQSRNMKVLQALSLIAFVIGVFLK